MKLSEEEIRIIQAVHWEHEHGLPHPPGNEIPKSLIDAGFIVQDQDGPFVPDEAKWKLLDIGVMLKPAKRKPSA